MKNRVKIKVVGESRVSWEETRNLSFDNLLKIYYQYGKGDTQVRIWLRWFMQHASHNIIISQVFLTYLLLFSLIILLPNLPKTSFLLLIGYLVYIIWSCLKMAGYNVLAGKIVVSFCPGCIRDCCYGRIY